MQLLKKVEELTLYTLQQEETIAQLQRTHQEQLAALMARIETLERTQKDNSK
ncbi:MAG: hypothetical protein AB7P18_10925 [Candidatus Binatia bacterium]